MLNNQHIRNRRRSIRHNTKRTTKVTCHGGKLGLGPNIARQVLDISETGARLRVSAECEAKQEIKLHLNSLSSRKPLIAEGEVVWCVATADGDYCIGVQFRKPIPYRDMTMM